MSIQSFVIVGKGKNSTVYSINLFSRLLFPGTSTREIIRPGFFLYDGRDDDILLECMAALLHEYSNDDYSDICIKT